MVERSCFCLIVLINFVRADVSIFKTSGMHEFNQQVDLCEGQEYLEFGLGNTHTRLWLNSARGFVLKSVSPLKN